MQQNNPLVSLRRILTPTERRGALVLLALMVVGMFLETLGIGLIVPAVALIVDANGTRQFPALEGWLGSLTARPREEVVLLGLVGLLLVYLLKNVFLVFLTWRQNRYTYGVRARVADDLFYRYLAQPYSFHLGRNSAQAIRNITVDTELFATRVVLPMLTVTTEALVVAGITALLLIVEPLGTLLGGGFLGGTGYVFHRMTRVRIGRWGRERQYHDGLRIQHVQQALGGVKEVKLLGLERAFLDSFAPHNHASARFAELRQTLNRVPRMVFEVLAVLGLVILVAFMQAQGAGVRAVGPTVAMFAAAAFRLLPSSNRIVSALQDLRFGAPVVGMLRSELELPMPEGETASNRTTLGRSSFTEALVAENVQFHYDGTTEPAIRNVSLSIRPGETIGIIGPSGAGKSTLVDLLIGLLEPTTGAVTLDGRDVGQRAGCRDIIGYVPQSIFLTDESLRKNIAFGVPEDEIDTDAVLRALREAQLDEFVANLPQGLDTKVGERGVRLSGGQRQRIGLARALYRDPAILVLDEATSALDVDTERDVMRAVRGFHGRKTVIIISHRLATVSGCDRLLSVRDGEVVEQDPSRRFGAGTEA